MGFYNAANIARRWVTKQLDSIRKNAIKEGKPEVLNKPIFITGHSLGGAIANLIMYNLINLNKLKKTLDKDDPQTFIPYNLKALYTFGTPRVGDVEWATSMKNAAEEAKVGLYRIVNGSDLITHSPCGDNYAHVGTLIQLQEADPTQFPDFLKKGLPTSAVKINPQETPLIGTTLLLPNHNSCSLETILKHPTKVFLMMKEHYMNSYFEKLAFLRNKLNDYFYESFMNTVQNKSLSNSKQTFEYPTSCNNNLSGSNLDFLKINSQQLPIIVEGKD